jgi:5-formyltetrahydrofolate cyclo-ligase
MKNALRQQVIARRDALPAARRAAASTAIAARVAGMRDWGEARCVLAYMSMGSEFDTAALIRAILDAGRWLSLPRVNKSARRLDLYRVHDTGRDLVSGTWGIREPDPERCEPLDGADVDLVLVPGVAFDARGGRLGYGGGYYDRLLPGVLPHAVRIAAAFQEQLVERVPLEDHDAVMDFVVTDAASYAAGKRRP